MPYARHIDAEIAHEPRIFGPLHPGVVLREEFMEPLGISRNELASALSVSPRRINEIVNEKRAITADTALRLSRCFGSSRETAIRIWGEPRSTHVDEPSRKSDDVYEFARTVFRISYDDGQIQSISKGGRN